MTNTENTRIQLEDSWKKRLLSTFDTQQMRDLRQFLLREKTQGKRIYPTGAQIFAALNLTPFDTVKVVILGQDPYHGPRQAHGLSFSVPLGVDIPPSLQNIYQELHSDLGIDVPPHGSLVGWAKQGVLLLNSVLTVEASLAGSHQGKGWESFTDEIIRQLNDNTAHLVFILWGAYAKSKGKIIDRHKHLVIESPHPSPLSAHRGFFGSRPFSKANAYLRASGKKEIDWRLT